MQPTSSNDCSHVECMAFGDYAPQNKVCFFRKVDSVCKLIPFLVYAVAFLLTVSKLHLSPESRCCCCCCFYHRTYGLEFWFSDNFHVVRAFLFPFSSCWCCCCCCFGTWNLCIFTIDMADRILQQRVCACYASPLSPDSDVCYVCMCECGGDWSQCKKLNTQTQYSLRKHILNLWIIMLLEWQYE